MFYFTRNFERQKKNNADADVDAEMPMPRFPNGLALLIFFFNWSRTSIKNIK